MRSSALDRESLARRNRRMALARHQPTAKHYVRNGVLSLIAKAPIPLQSGANKRILIVRPDHLGDLLLTTPAIRLIKRQRPELGIHVLCGEWCADLLADFKEVDQVLTLPFPGFRRGAAGATPYALALQSARKLRRIGYDSAIIMRPDHWWGALLAKLAGIRQRIGYDQPGVAPFLTVARRLAHQHVVEQNLRLAEAFTGNAARGAIQLDLPLRTEDGEIIDAQLAALGIAAGAPIICIHPGSGAASKVWRAEMWAAVADALARDYEARVVFTGTANERALIAEVAAEMNAEANNIAGATSIGQLAALYRRALIVLGPDSGAMHIAAAVKTSTVALFGPADPIEFAPWGDRRRQAVVTAAIACRPCRILDWRGDNPDYHPCVSDITVEQVLVAAREVMGAGGGPPPPAPPP